MITYRPDRGVVEVGGVDRVGFLQGLVSNDVAEVAPGRAVWAALLTPQGKYLADFFMLAAGEVLLLECAAAHVFELAQKLTRFRLRSRVTVRDVSADWHVHVAWGALPGLPDDVVVAPDPRLEPAGWRVLSARLLPTDATAAAWDAHRLALGLPESGVDLEQGRTVLLEAGFDELHGVSWSKGCYMGQELTARTKYRGLIKRRLVPVEAEGTLPPPGSAIMAEGREVGTLHAGRGTRALATVRVEAFDQALSCAGTRLIVRLPGWMAASEEGQGSALDPLGAAPPDPHP